MGRPLELIDADHCLGQCRLVEGSREDLAAPASTVHVGLPAVENVVQLGSVEVGLVVVDQPGHGVLGDRTHPLLLCID